MALDAVFIHILAVPLWAFHNLIGMSGMNLIIIWEVGKPSNMLPNSRIEVRANNSYPVHLPYFTKWYIAIRIMLKYNNTHTYC